MTKGEFEQLLQRYGQGTCTADEARRVQRWFDQLETGGVPALTDSEKDAIQARLLNRIEAQLDARSGQFSPDSRVRSWLPSRRPVSWAAAAVVLMALSWGWLTHPGAHDRSGRPTALVLTHAKRPANVFTARSGPQTVRLPDGSQVRLQPGSTLFVADGFGQRRREVELQGNAFFDIVRHPDKPFLVYCGETVTQVLGTSFWIHSPGKDKPVEVSVRTGRVTVFENPAQTPRAVAKRPNAERNGVILTPNQKVVFYPHQRHLVTGLVARPQLLLPPQQAPLFAFDGLPLPEVFRTLEKGYGVEIITSEEKLPGCTFSGDLTDLSLEEKLRLICESVNASYEIRGTRILVVGKGCH